MKHFDRIWAEIDLDAAVFNMESMRTRIPSTTKMIGVIKANGYGHGSIEIARELEKLDYVYGYAVATSEEGIVLRRANIKKPIIILGYSFPSSYEDIILNDIQPTVFQSEDAKELSDIAQKHHKNVCIHVKVDTGMSRIGVIPNQNGIMVVKEIISHPNIIAEGIYTHFATADCADKTKADIQLGIFNEFTKKLKNEGVMFNYYHTSNSAGIIEMKESHLDLVRAGITLYGLWPSDEVKKDIISLKPVMSLKSKIAFIKKLPVGKEISYGGTFVTYRETNVATVPVGYADGYPRNLSGKGYVLINGKKAPILGRICMDQCMIDVTDIENVKAGDIVTLIGNDGDLTISLEDVAELSNGFNYELACNIGMRVPRVYYKNKEIIEEKDYLDLFK